VEQELRKEGLLESGGAEGAAAGVAMDQVDGDQGEQPRTKPKQLLFLAEKALLQELQYHTDRALEIAGRLGRVDLSSPAVREMEGREGNVPLSPFSQLTHFPVPFSSGCCLSAVVRLPKVPIAFPFVRGPWTSSSVDRVCAAAGGVRVWIRAGIAGAVVSVSISCGLAGGGDSHQGVLA
jgi:hypothetical protein